MTEPPTRNYHREIVEERDRLREDFDSMRKDRDAWQRLAEGHVQMTDTVTVPRWALEHVLDSAVPPSRLSPLVKMAKWAGAMTALQRALNTKTEMPEEPGHCEIVEERDRLRIENQRLQERNTSLAKENFNLFELLNERDRLLTALKVISTYLEDCFEPTVPLIAIPEKLDKAVKDTYIMVRRAIKGDTIE